MNRKVACLIRRILLPTMALAVIWSPASTVLSDAPATKASPNDRSSEAATHWVAPDHEASRERAGEVVPFVDEVMDECRLCRHHERYLYA